METLSSLIGGLSSPSRTGPASSPARAVSSPPPAAHNTSCPFQSDDLQRIVYNLFQGDTRVQQQTLDEDFTDDVAFTDGLVSLSGREQLAKLMAAINLLADIKPEIVSINLHPDRALVLVNLRLAWRVLPWTFWRRLHVPLLIELTFSPHTLISRGLIRAQRFHMSHAGLFWYGQNPVADWAYRALWAPRSGLLLSLANIMLDNVRGSWDHTFGKFLLERKQGASLYDASMSFVKSTTGLLRGTEAPADPVVTLVTPSKGAVPAAAAGNGAAQEAH